MLETFKCNFSSKFKQKSRACDYCSSQETELSDKPRDCQNHALIECPQYAEFRIQYDIQTDLGIVQFFRAVIDKRLEEEKD